LCISVLFKAHKHQSQEAINPIPSLHRSPRLYFNL